MVGFLICVLVLGVACTFHHSLWGGGGAFCPGALRSCLCLGPPRIPLGACKKQWVKVPDKLLVAIMMMHVMSRQNSQSQNPRARKGSDFLPGRPGPAAPHPLSPAVKTNLGFQGTSHKRQAQVSALKGQIPVCGRAGSLLAQWGGRNPTRENLGGVE